MRVNFHTHSNVSDGLLTPRELIEKLNSDQVKYCALTDHDRLKGLEEAKKAATEYGIKFVSGIEISCNLKGVQVDGLDQNTYGVHILGLNFDLEKLSHFYRQRESMKRQRINVLLNSLIEDGYEIDKNIRTDRKTIIAQELVEKGYAENVQDAFNNIINYYYDKFIDNMNVKDAIDLIHQAGGISIWAHPFEILQHVKKVSINCSLVEILCNRLKMLGLNGLEVYYEPYVDKQINFLKKMQRKYNFKASFGTDYHGKENQPATYVDINESLVKELLF